MSLPELRRVGNSHTKFATSSSSEPRVPVLIARTPTARWAHFGDEMQDEPLRSDPKYRAGEEDLLSFRFRHAVHHG